MFGENILSETPATDPKTIVGRNIEVGVDELLGNQNKYYMKLCFLIEEVDGKKAYTRFNGFSSLREYLTRVVRKRSQKVRVITDIETKDGWKLQATLLSVLNRNAEAGIQTKVRLALEKDLQETAKNTYLEDFIKSIINNSIQVKLKKLGTKIYPVKFTEMERIEVVKPGTGKEEKPKEEKKAVEKPKEAKNEGKEEKKVEKPEKESAKPKEKPKETDKKTKTEKK